MAACDHQAEAPAVAVLSTLYPSSVRPHAGLFVHERMLRVAEALPLTVVSPVPWFPFQRLLAKLRPGFRPAAPRREVRDGIEVLHPRFFSIPGCLKSLDGLFLALGALPTLLALKRSGRVDVIDAHFGYPDGYAASLLGRWLRVPFTVTLRGTEPRLARQRLLGRLLARGVRRAQRVIAVADSLRRLAVRLGVPEERTVLVPNAVDSARFRPLPKPEARAPLRIAPDAQVLITVGGLCERKGFHRVIEILPSLQARFPRLLYLVVGAAGPEGDWGARLREQARALGVEARVRFTGAVDPDDLPSYLSAADVFVLATRNEGWANVFLEAMACGLPVVTTDVGGNPEVISRSELGLLVPFGDRAALEAAVTEALTREWARDVILAHARAHTWERRIPTLMTVFHEAVHHSDSGTRLTDKSTTL